MRYPNEASTTSQRRAAFVRVPQLIGLSIPSAAAKLQHDGFLLDVKFAESGLANPKPDAVYLETPSAGAHVARGTQVHLVVSYPRHNSPIFGLCQTSQLQVSVSPNHLNRATQTFVFGITVTNLGGICYLLDKQPGFDLVLGAAHQPIGSGPFSDLMWRTPIILAHHQSSSASGFVGRQVDSNAYCHIQSADGLKFFIGTPYSSSIYVRHLTPGICSASSQLNNVGSSNYGPAFYVTAHNA